LTLNTSVTTTRHLTSEITSVSMQVSPSHTVFCEVISVSLSAVHMSLHKQRYLVQRYLDSVFKKLIFVVIHFYFQTVRSSSASRFS